MAVLYEVALRLDCGPCGEAMYHVVSSRLPMNTGGKRWSFHLFRCENCGDEKAIYETMADPREANQHGIYECRYCHETLLEGDPGIGHDNVSGYWWHTACAKKQPRPRAIQP